MDWLLIWPVALVFILGYGAIIFEEPLRTNKTASALGAAALGWLLYFLLAPGSHGDHTTTLAHHLEGVAQIIFFLLSAMAIVEIIDAHQGFRLVTQMIKTRNRLKLLWLVGVISFVLSAVLDNLTTTIVMIGLLRKLVPARGERLLLGAAIVVAANAGGAWTPIGDVTTTMLWIGGRITTLPIMKSLLLPSLVTLVVFLLGLSPWSTGEIPETEHHEPQPAEPGAKLILCLGLLALVSVPLFKTFTGMPPYMGALFGLAVLWAVTDHIHRAEESRQHLLLPEALSRLDVPGVLFFLGILLAVAAVEATGALTALAHGLNNVLVSETALAIVIGLISAVIDNVPLVAATMGMYPLSVVPVDASLWELIALCAGTGGSILVIGSAAGVAFMSLEQVSFGWYLKRVSILALAAYLAGVAAYVIL